MGGHFTILLIIPGMKNHYRDFHQNLSNSSNLFKIGQKYQAQYVQNTLRLYSDQSGLSHPFSVNGI